MVRAWYMQDPVKDQFLENHLDPPQIVSQEDLHKRTGIFSAHIDLASTNENDALQNIPQASQCGYRDVVEISPEKMGDEFNKKVAIFFDEHLHTDEEVRFILAGSGYFDVRDCDDKWIRIACERGDFIVLPAGIYHRFTVDGRKYIKAMRLFAGVPVWTPHNRGQAADQLPARDAYLSKHGLSVL
ncbi:acireductone dioxygenase-like isoform X2 [Paramacrobiotus metropolitanus]|uniref:acireductone dioxygenase-like isoform X2 n=1 Tax=Paramacrobiotus metropolitanus TaxID=2943436 RepID=UPI0024460C91|nr:acireductone dioxygenase-like isoform X2 [Paramacrobiotus metropolitanus]